MSRKPDITIVAIDPGPERSAYVVWDGATVGMFGKIPNQELLELFGRFAGLIDGLVIEEVASYGMPVGREVFETVFWSGRFAERCELFPWYRLTRQAVKLHVCQSPRANDSTIRQALIDRFGGKDAAIGRKAAPGPCYGLARDTWQALALAVTWWDLHAGARLTREAGQWEDGRG